MLLWCEGRPCPRFPIQEVAVCTINALSPIQIWPSEVAFCIVHALSLPIQRGYLFHALLSVQSMLPLMRFLCWLNQPG